MKFTVAATLLATSVTATSGSDHSVANDAASASHRGLAVSLEDRFEVTSVLKERRASKNKGKVIRNLQRKLQQRQLGNEDEEDSQVHEEDLDLGIFSRGLQANATEPEEELSVMEQLIELCGDTEETDESFSCTCADLNVEAYTASVTCAYAENCLTPTEDICGGNTTFCFLETYNLEVTAPGTGSSAICYELTSPLSFNYCYGLTYTDESTTPSGCVLEVEGNQCNSCEFYFYDSQPNVTCNNFDCSNADETIGSGIICGDDTIVSAKIEDHLTYAPLPCEGGCNICPSNGEMSLVDNNVTMITGDVYQCWQLNLAAQAGYLQDMPGDLCNSLLEVVNEPCGCVVPPATEVPEVTPTSDEDTNPEAAPTDAPMSSTEPNEASDGATVKSGFSFAATALAATFSWMII